MKVWLTFILITSSAWAQGVQPIESLDLTRYSGTWYEIARLPNRFQKDCVANTSATYSLTADGFIQVENSCQENNGKTNITLGRARSENAGNTQLTVTFVNIFGRWIFAFGGDYWVIALEDNYQWVVVGHPERSYGWILARNPSQLTTSQLNDIKAALISQGYQPCDFISQAQGPTLALDIPNWCK